MYFFLISKKTLLPRNLKKKHFSLPLIVQDWVTHPHPSAGCRCCSVAQSCLTLCDPMDWSTSSIPVLHNLPEFAQIHVHWMVMPSNHLVDAINRLGDSIQPLSSPSCQSFSASGSFLMNQLYASGGQSTGASTSASVLLMNIQDWFPWGWTGLISLQSKGLSRVFSNTTVQKHQFFGT